MVPRKTKKGEKKSSQHQKKRRKKKAKKEFVAEGVQHPRDTSETKDYCARKEEEEESYRMFSKH